MIKTSRGFTLIEMAIVLIIITILIGGLAVPLSTQIQARRIAETQKTMAEAREAIIGYAMSHSVTASCACNYSSLAGTPDSTDCPATVSCPVISPPPASNTTLTLAIPTRYYLPCPDLNGADPEPGMDNDGDGDATNDINNGREDRFAIGTCSTDSGNVPWVTLGTANQDAWGNRLRYAITGAFSNLAGFSNTDTGDLQICNTSANSNTSDCGALGNVASNVPVVLISHGPNGWGARNINGNTLASPSSNNEKENANSDTVDKEFVSRTPSRTGDSAGEFDDLVKWISADQLRGRVCPDGGCP